MSKNFLMTEARQMRPLDEILCSLKEKHGYTDQEISELSQNLDHFTELSYMAFREQKKIVRKKTL